MRNPMFEFDEAMTELVFEYCRERLALDPVELDFGGVFPVSFADHLDGVVNPAGNDAGSVMRLYADTLAPAVISVDSPRYLSFIPAAPTKASLLFDMVVSCSSLNGTSWLEAAGAVAAENQVLRYLADRAGLPSTAGGCFVSGGSLGNLSALVVARDTAGERGKVIGGGRPRVAVSEEAHSSIAGALNIIGADPLLVPVADHRLTGPALEAALAAEDTLADVVAVVATAGTTNAGIIDDLRGIGEVAAAHSLGSTWTAHTAGRAFLSDVLQPRYDGIGLADSLIVDPHKWLFAPFDSCRPALPPPASGQGRPRPARRLPRRDPGRGVETQRLLGPPDPAGPGAAPCGSRWRSTAPTPTPRPSSRRWTPPPSARPGSGPPPISSSSGAPTSRW